MKSPAALALCLSFLFAVPASAAQAQQQSAPYAATQTSFIRLAELADNAPVIARIKIIKAIALKAERTPDVPADKVRFYVEAGVEALIRSDTALPQNLRLLIDMPRDYRGKAPKIKKKEFLVFARDSGRPGEIQLIRSDAWLAWQAADEAQLRNLVRAMLAPDAPPAITGIREALHVRGNLIGEGETQIFLSTDNGAPVSLGVVRRPGQQPRWAVSLTEIVDAAARPPERGTLLWYRLACFLPRDIPQRALVSNTQEDNQQARQDYQLILQALGPCSDAAAQMMDAPQARQPAQPDQPAQPPQTEPQIRPY